MSKEYEIVDEEVLEVEVIEDLEVIEDSEDTVVQSDDQVFPEDEVSADEDNTDDEVIVDEENSGVLVDGEYYDIDFDEIDKMDDDEALIALDKIISQNDTVLEKEYLSSLVDQGDNVVFYEIENIYRNEKTKAYRNRLKMRQDPPVLVVKDYYESEVRFILTENLVEELLDTLQQVKRAYLGFSKPSPLDAPKDLVGRVGHYAKENPVKFLMASIVIILFVGIFIKGMIG